MKKILKPILIVLFILNLVVLLGQVWPEGAPPFARTVNMIFLIGNLLLLFAFMTSRDSK